VIPASLGAQTRGTHRAEHGVVRFVSVEVTMARLGFSRWCALGAATLMLACGEASQHASDGSGGHAGQSGGAGGMASGGHSGASGRSGMGGRAAGAAGETEVAGRENAGTGGSSGGSGGAPGGHGGTQDQAGASPGGRAGAGNSGGGAAAGNGGATSGGSGGMGGGGAGGAVTAINALFDTIDAYCSAVTACCQGATIPSDDCNAIYASNQPAVASLTDGSVTVDMTALATCKAAYGAGPDQCNLNAVVKACAGVYVGLRAAGEPCTNLYDCDRSAGAMSCVVLDPNTDPVGTCQKVPHLQAGDDCSFACRIGDDCSSTSIGATDALGLCFESDGLVCDYGSGQCRSIVALGEACTEDGQCGSEAYCDGSNCQARSGVGEPCGGGVSCRHELQCGDDGNCADPSWTSSSACTGYAPAP
jgi:hypothetical protein